MTSLSDPCAKAAAVTKSDTTRLDGLFGGGNGPRALYIGGTGDLSVVMLNDEGAETTVVFTTVPVGILPIRVRKVLNATTATNIVALA